MCLSVSLDKLNEVLYVCLKRRMCKNREKLKIEQKEGKIFSKKSLRWFFFICLKTKIFSQKESWIWAEKINFRFLKKWKKNEWIEKYSEGSEEKALHF